METRRRRTLRRVRWTRWCCSGLIWGRFCGYTFLSQIFDYGNTAIEKRSIFYRRLLPLLEFTRDREGIDLSKEVLTHHNLRNLGKRSLPLPGGDKYQLKPSTEAGSGQLRVKEQALLSELIEKVNDLFQGEVTEGDKLTYVKDVLKGKLLESEKLQQQASNNTKEQFSNSPDLKTEILNAVMEALDAHATGARRRWARSRFGWGSKTSC